MSNYILTRYVLREHLGPFCYSLAVITLVFVLDLLFRYLNRLLSKGLPWMIVLEFFWLNMAWIVATAVPMAVLTATLMAFGRLAVDNEIAAMHAGGVSLWRQVLPVFMAAALLAAGLIWFNDNILPDCNLRVRTLAADIVRQKPSVNLEPGVWYNEIPHYGLLAQTLEDSAGLTHARQLLIDDNSRSEVRRTISARSGLIQSNPAEGAFLLTLFDGEIQELNLMKVEEFRRLTFSKHIMSIGAQESFMPESESQTRTDREKSTPRMWQEVGNARAKIAFVREQLDHLGKQPSWSREREEKTAETQRLEAGIQTLLVEIHKKYAIPAACIVFVLIGAPLGALARRGGIAAGAGLSLGFFLFYWAGLIGGEVLADRRMLSPFFAMWAANFITVSLGAFVFRYVAAGNLEPPSFEVIARLRAIFAREVLQQKSGKLRRGEDTASAGFKLPEHKKAEAKEERSVVKLNQKAKTKGQRGVIKFDQKTKTKEERGLVTIEPKTETSKALDVIKFDVAEPEFVARLQTVPAMRRLAASTPRSGLKPLHEILREFIKHARLTLVVLSDRNGMVKTSGHNPIAPPSQLVDCNKLAALAAAQMSMVQILGKALNEEGEFTCIFQEGERYNLFIYHVERDFILTVLAERTVALGLVRVRANEAVAQLSRSLSLKPRKMS